MSRPKVIVREPSLTDSDNVGTAEDSWAPGSNTAGNSREPAGKASDSWGPLETALDSLGPVETAGNSWEPVKTSANSRGHGGTSGDSWGSAGTVGNSCGSSGAVDNEENLRKMEKDSTLVSHKVREFHGKKKKVIL
jgi:hypothetical protein